MTDCEHLDDAGAFVLRAMEPDEAERYRRHLEGCETCRQEVAGLAGVVDALPMAAPQLPAPPALKGRIMAEVEAEAELLRAAGPQADRPPARASRAGGFLERLRLRPAAALAGACALLAVGVVTGAVLSSGDGGQDVRTYAAQAEGAASVRVEVSDGQAELVMRDMPPPPAGRVYQVWLARDGAPQPTRTLFDVPADGQARVTIGEPVGGVEQVLVTAEPEGGSVEPTREPVVVASLS